MIEKKCASCWYFSCICITMYSSENVKFNNCYIFGQMSLPTEKGLTYIGMCLIQNVSIFLHVCKQRALVAPSYETPVFQCKLETRGQ